MGKNIGRVLTGGLSGRSKKLDSVIDPLGLFKGPEIAQIQTPNKSYFDMTNEANQAQANYAPILQANQANAAAVAPGQQQALAQMALAATGQGPSLAEAQLRSAQDRGFSQQLAAAQAQRSQSPALAQRQLLLNMGNANRDLAQQSAIQRLQERDSFLNQANQVQGNLRQDVANQFNYATAPKAGLQQWEQIRTGNVNAQNQAQATADNATRGAIMSGIGAVGGTYFGGAAGGKAGAAIGGAMAQSDKNAKKDISKSNDQMKDFLAALTASKYAYKDTTNPGTAPGPRFGVMAQDLEKTAVGKSMVKDTPTGKQVDYGQGFGALLASQAALHERLEKLEGNPGYGKVLQTRKKKKD